MCCNATGVEIASDSFNIVEFTLGFSILTMMHLMLASVALMYYIQKYQASREQIVLFFERLSLPLKPFFSVKPHMQFYEKMKNIDDLPAYLIETKYPRYARLLGAFLSLFVIFFNATTLEDTQTKFQSIYVSAFLIMHCYFFYGAWHFGHRLKGIEVTQP